jgi:hypothetical protein
VSSNFIFSHIVSNEATFTALKAAANRKVKVKLSLLVIKYVWRSGGIAQFFYFGARW